MFSSLNFIESSALTLIAVSAFAIAALAYSRPQTMTGGSVAPAFRGEWVPVKATCTSPLRIKIEPTTVTFINGDERAEYRKLDQCFACMGHDVENVTMLTTEAQGDSPFTIYLDGSKKKAAVQVDFSNDKKLGKRFPFGAGSLKKCK